MENRFFDLPKEFAEWLAAKCDEEGGDAALGRRVGIGRASVGRYKKGLTTRIEYGTLTQFVRAFPELKSLGWFSNFSDFLVDAPVQPGLAADILLESIAKTWPGLTVAERVKAWQYVDGIVKGRG